MLSEEALYDSQRSWKGEKEVLGLDALGTFGPEPLSWYDFKLQLSLFSEFMRQGWNLMG